MKRGHLVIRKAGISGTEKSHILITSRFNPNMTSPEWSQFTEPQSIAQHQVTLHDRPATEHLALILKNCELSLSQTDFIIYAAHPKVPPM